MASLLRFSLTAYATTLCIWQRGLRLPGGLPSVELQWTHAAQSERFAGARVWLCSHDLCLLCACVRAYVRACVRTCVCECMHMCLFAHCVARKARLTWFHGRMWLLVYQCHLNQRRTEDALIFLIQFELSEPAYSITTPLRFRHVLRHMNAKPAL
jgi:hypothetical protein